MKLLITVAALAAALNSPAAAQTAAGALPSERPAIAAASLPTPADNAPRGRFCWSGKPDSTAAGLGMPALFCVSATRVARAEGGYSAEVTGAPLGGRVSAEKDGDAWKLTLLKKEDGYIPCSDGSSAIIELRVKTDDLGYLTGVPEVSARSEYTGDVCHSDTHVTEIAYTRSDPGAARRQWRRGPDAAADKLGMPAEVSLEGLHLEGDKLFIAAGSPASGLRPVSFRGEGDTRRAEAVLFSAETGGACWDGAMAEITVSFLAGRDGAILSDPELKARSGYSSDICHSPWHISELPFEKK